MHSCCKPASCSGAHTTVTDSSPDSSHSPRVTSSYSTATNRRLVLALILRLLTVHRPRLTTSAPRWQCYAQLAYSPHSAVVTSTHHVWPALSRLSIDHFNTSDVHHEVLALPYCHIFFCNSRDVWGIPPLPPCYEVWILYVYISNTQDKSPIVLFILKRDMFILHSVNSIMVSPDAVSRQPYIAAAVCTIPVITGLCVRGFTA